MTAWHGKLGAASWKQNAARFLAGRAGTLVAKGSYVTATVTTSGAGATFITGGTIGRVTASASGVGRIVIDPTNREPAWVLAWMLSHMSLPECKAPKMQCSRQSHN